MIALVNIAVIGIALIMVMSGYITLRRDRPTLGVRKRGSRRSGVDRWEPPAHLTDEDRAWLDYHSRLDLEGWVAYNSRKDVKPPKRDSLPGAAIMRERHVAGIDPSAALERIIRARGDISSHDVIAAMRGKVLEIKEHRADGTCLLVAAGRNKQPVYLWATRELMMQVTGADLPGRRGACKFHAWSTEVLDVGSLDGRSKRVTRTTCIDCGADYDNPREWNGGW